MCGFVGCAGSNINIKTDKLNDALDSIIHRGPDDRGVETGDWWCLGFQRLSILDLSQNGHQPMISQSSNTVITFNGELYNYNDIKQILISSNIRLKGDSDTEVLLEFYEYLNGDIEFLLSKCNGMFAFVIVDKVRDKILFARDRLGVKPLYYSCIDNELVFGSEIKGMKSLISKTLTISNDAVFSYFRLGFVPSWECIYNEIKSLEPGYWAEWSCKDNKIKLHKYWIPDINKGILDDNPINTLSELLEDATKIRLNSDVPVGVFLSGGIDSGLVASQVKKCGKDDVVAHTVRFPGWDNDESPLSQKTADFLGINLKIHDADLPSISKIVKLISHFDQPFSDPSAIATSLVCEEASNDVTVILSGDGGDEVFAGYREYPRALKYGWIDNMPDIFSNLIGNLMSRSGNRKVHNIGKRLNLSSCVRSAWTHIYPEDDRIERLLNSKWDKHRKFNPEVMRTKIKGYGNISPLQKAQLGDLSLYLPDNVLRKVDRMSMMHSLEVRSPFLDYRLVEFGLSLPSKLKIEKGFGKKILRDLSKELLPLEIQNSEKKGFGVPLDSYLITNNKITPFIYDSIVRLGDTDWFNKTKLIEFLEGVNATKEIRNVYRLFCFSVWIEAQH